MLFWFQEFINQPMTGDITAAWFTGCPSYNCLLEVPLSFSYYMLDIYLVYRKRIIFITILTISLSCGSKNSNVALWINGLELLFSIFILV